MALLFTRSPYVGRGRSASGSGWSPPYSLPSAGQAKQIEVNTAQSTTPSEWTWGAWQYCNFGSYGGGTFNPYYGVAGAYCFGPSGGHNHPDNPGLLIFDFATATWQRIDNASGHGRKSSPPYSYAVSETNGSPWYEINGLANVPCPPHPYRLSFAKGGGSSGAVVLLGRVAVAQESVNTYAVHQFDVGTATWSRLSTTGSPASISVESDAILDLARQRVWLTVNQQHSYQLVNYLDLSTLAWQAVTFSGWPSSGVAAGDTVLHAGMLLRNCGPSNGLWLFDPDNVPSGGWIQLNVSGTLPPISHRWAPYGGKWYSVSSSGGSVLTRITPPSNPKTGTWVVDTVTLGGDIPLGASDNGGGSGYYHHTRLCYVPAIDCLAWMPGTTAGVWIIRPE